MSKIWSEADIQTYIDDEVQESLTLDYKAAAALAKDDKKRAEITKDVSAMANSAGGLIIYGVAEYQQADKKHLPEKIDPVDGTHFSKEWLEHVVNNIRPKIEKLVIHPVQLSNAPNQFVYVVEIPQSTTAHQATDKRYYKRFNFMSEAMEDYEIRDVMRRLNHPKIELEFEIESRRKNIGHSGPIQYTWVLKMRATNLGQVYAMYVNCQIKLPVIFLQESLATQMQQRGELTSDDNGIYYFELWRDNTVSDDLDIQPEKSGTRRFSPILPSLSHVWERELPTDPNRILHLKHSNATIKWKVFADNAPINSGSKLVSQIAFTDK